ncbi:hypothetical protein Tco_0793699 [Tanacetum coccineum]
MRSWSTNLKELSDKGFIRPSSSPWGAPVCLSKKKEGVHPYVHLITREHEYADGKNRYPLPEDYDLFRSTQVQHATTEDSLNDSSKTPTTTKRTQRRSSYEWSDKEEASFLENIINIAVRQF